LVQKIVVKLKVLFACYEVMQPQLIAGGQANTVRGRIQARAVA
jgi:hypothetical protein